MENPEKYILTVLALGKRPKIEMNKEKFEKLKQAKKTLSKALSFEEQYEIVMHNYLEFEKGLSNMNIEKMVRDPSDYLDFFNYKIIANIKIINFFSSARLYTDNLPKHVAGCLNGRTTLEEAKRLVKEIGEKNFYYRFVNALRNYTLHESLPVHNIISGGKWTDANLIEHYSDFYVRKENLKDTRFTKHIFDEMSEKISLVSAIRHYLECVSQIHKEARRSIGQRVSDARDLIESTIDDYKKVDGQYQECTTGLSAVHYDEKGQCIEEISLLLNWDDVRLNLMKKNRRELTNLHKQYITTQVISESKKKTSKPSSK